MVLRVVVATGLASLLFIACESDKSDNIKVDILSSLDSDTNFFTDTDALEDTDVLEDTDIIDDTDSSFNEGLNCQTPLNEAGPDVKLAAEFQTHYSVYDLGRISGIPNPIGGITVKFGDPNTLLVAGKSEKPAGAIYEVKVKRGPCGHILGFESEGVLVAKTPYVDANLVYFPGKDLLFYTNWPKFTLSQLPYGATAPAVKTNLIDFGMSKAGDQGPGGVGFVPPGILDTAGEMRVVTWPGGRWYHVALKSKNGLFDVVGIRQTTRLPNEPGGFAYVPAGSPGFDDEAVIVAEWREAKPKMDRVAVYDLNEAGDPIVSTRRELLTKFPRPWGAYFEPVTGDYLFLSWGTGADRVYLIQGFVPPPVVI